MIAPQRAALAVRCRGRVRRFFLRKQSTHAPDWNPPHNASPLLHCARAPGVKLSRSPTLAGAVGVASPHAGSTAEVRAKFLAGFPVREVLTLAIETIGYKQWRNSSVRGGASGAGGKCFLVWTRRLLLSGKRVRHQTKNHGQNQGGCRHLHRFSPIAQARGSSVSLPASALWPQRATGREPRCPLQARVRRHSP